MIQEIDRVNVMIPPIQSSFSPLAIKGLPPIK